MPALECQDGHLVLDESALRCPECGTYVQTRRVSPSPYRPDRDSSTRSRLLFGSVGLAAGAGVAFVLTAGLNLQFAYVLAGLIGFAAATMWVVACVAFGVRGALSPAIEGLPTRIRSRERHLPLLC
jgi:hypothetical protein